MRIAILTNDRKVKRMKVRSGATSFTYKRKMYEVEPEAVYMTEWPGRRLKKSQPTCFYFENSPGPIKHVKQGEPREDTSYKSLERSIRINAVSQQSSPSLGSRLGPIIETVGPYISFYNIFLLIVAVSLIWGWIQGATSG